MSIHNNPNENKSSNLSKDIKREVNDLVQTALPAVITNIKSFGGKQLVSAKPLVDETTPDFIALEYPEIPDIPVVFPSAGGGLLSFPIAKGDTVLLVFSKRALGEWLIGDGSQVSPKTYGSFNLTDAIAIPGLYTTKSHLSPNTTDVELKFAGSSVKLKPDGDVHVSAAKDATVTCAGNMILSSAGNIDITAVGDVNISGATVNLN